MMKAMIKLCLFSDSHGSPQPMIAAIEKEEPDICFFLGDGERDLEAVRKAFPKLPVYAVRGNCDPRSRLSSFLVCTVGEFRIFATHGHLYNVKYEPELDSLASAAEEAGARLVFFGHTHRACMKFYEKFDDRITLINPGPIGRTVHPRYALLAFDGRKYRVWLKRFDPTENAES